MTSAKAEPLFILQHVLPFESRIFSTVETELAWNERLTFDSYFQLLHLEALSKIEGESCRLGISLHGSGFINLRIVRVSDQPSETVLIINELDLESTGTACLTLPKSKLRGILKIEIFALSKVTVSALSVGDRHWFSALSNTRSRSASWDRLLHV